MIIVKVCPVEKNDIAARNNQEITPKNYYKAIFEHNEKEYTATIRIATNHIADCRNEERKKVRLREETQDKLIQLVNEYNKKIEMSKE